jgi:hypothetical protein
MHSDFRMKLHVPAPSSHFITGDDSRVLQPACSCQSPTIKPFFLLVLFLFFFITPPTTSSEHPQQSNQAHTAPTPSIKHTTPNKQLNHLRQHV